MNEAQTKFWSQFTAEEAKEKRKMYQAAHKAKKGVSPYVDIVATEPERFNETTVTSD